MDKFELNTDRLKRSRSEKSDAPVARRLSVRVVVACALAGVVVSALPAAATTPFPMWMSNGLNRTMTEKERAYFGQPLADVVAAMSKASHSNHGGPCVAELSSGEPADMSRPSQWLRIQGRLTPAGLAPSTWEVPVSCPKLHAVVTLSPVPLTVVPDPGAKSNAVGVDVFSTSGQLVIGDFTIATTRTATPEPRTAAAEDAWDSMPALARPVAIRIRADQSAGDLSDYIDVDAARAALSGVKGPDRPPPVVEAEQQMGDPETIARTEAAVLSFVIGRNGPRKTVVIADKTWRGGLPGEAERVIPRVAPEILGSAISDYREKNRQSISIPANLSVAGTNVAFVTEEALRTYFGNGNTSAGWTQFSKSYGETALYTFSRVGLSHDLSQAVIFEGYQGPRVGVGSLLFLRQEGNTWRVMYQLGLWVESTERSYRVDDRVSRRTKPSKPETPATTPEATPTPATPPEVATTEPSAPAAPKEQPKEPTPEPVAPKPEPVATPTPEAPPSKLALAHVKVQFVNTVDMFRFDKAEFFVNGEPAGAPVKKADAGSKVIAVWEGDIPAGESVLRVSTSYFGKGFFPFYYLEAYPFRRDAVHWFSVKKNGNATITVEAQQHPSATTAMEDALELKVKEEGTEAKVTLFAPLMPTTPVVPPKAGVGHLKVRFVSDVGSFKFDRAEFAINGESAGMPLESLSNGPKAEVWTGDVTAGSSVLRVRVRFTGKGFFPFYYLDSYPFERELTHNFTLKKDGPMTLVVHVFEEQGLTKPMEDALAVEVRQE